MIPTAMVCLGLALGGPANPRAVAREFLTAYLKQGLDVGHLEGARAVTPFLSQRLRQVLDDAGACQADWARQQPKDSTDKQPFVDCCLFASSPEGIPPSFKVGPSELLPDRRYKVFIDFTYADPPGTYSDPAIPLQTSHWRDAVILVQAAGSYLIDDFLFLRDSPREPPVLLSESFEGCRGPHWSEQQQPERASHALNVKFNDLKWDRIVPELGERSSEITILRVDPTTQATQLMIRVPKNTHVPKHWHSANETHTVLSGTFVIECEGQRLELGAGSFNYVPKKMAHEAWTKTDEGTLLFITVDKAWDINWVGGPPKPEDFSPGLSR